MFSGVLTDNGINERFNRNLKEEFIEVNPYFEPYLYEDNLDQANKKLTEYLVFYNLYNFIKIMVKYNHVRNSGKN